MTGRVRREPDFRQPARSAQGGRAGRPRLGAAAGDLPAADPAVARPGPRPRRRGRRPGAGGARRHGPRDPPVRAAAGGVVPGLAPAGHREQGAGPTASNGTGGPPSGSTRPTGSSTGWPSRTATLAREWDLDHDRHVFRKLQTVVQPDFTPTTWEAFRRFALDGLPAAEVAEDLGLTVNAVLQAKSRILKRLREEAGDLLG